jgi:hypothetical protein
MKIQRAKRLFQIVSLVLTVTFALLLQVHFVQAEGIGIVPASGIDADNIIFGGQSVSFSTSQYTPTDISTLVVTSILNVSLTGSISITSSGTGFWTILMIGTGGRNWINFAYGLIAPSGGNTASVDIDDGISLGILIGNTNVTSEVSADKPFKYSLTIKGAASL